MEARGGKAEAVDIGVGARLSELQCEGQGDVSFESPFDSTEPTELPPDVEAAPEDFVFDMNGTTRDSLGPRYGPEITDAEFKDWFARGLNGENAPKGSGRRASARRMAWARGFWRRQAALMPSPVRRVIDGPLPKRPK